MIAILSFILLSGTPSARAAHDVPNDVFLNEARPLIEAFLAEQNPRYRTNFAPQPDSWMVRSSIYGIHPLDYALFLGRRMDGSCREVSAVIDPQSGARAIFYVKLSYPKIPKSKERGPAEYKLVKNCVKDKNAGEAPELRVEGTPTQRLFTSAEFAQQAKPLIQAYLRTNGHGEALDEASIEVRRSGVDLDNGYARRFYRKLSGRTAIDDQREDDDDRGSFNWLYRKIYGRNLACRRVRVNIPDEAMVLTTYVVAWYNTTEWAQNLPEGQQTIVYDPRTLKPYRFALADGCDQMGLFDPPTMKLTPMPGATPAPELIPPPTPNEQPEPLPNAPEVTPRPEPARN